jgi:hypothetical protein
MKRSLQTTAHALNFKAYMENEIRQIDSLNGISNQCFCK